MKFNLRDMKNIAFSAGLLLMLVHSSARAQTEVITSTKNPWDMSSQELMDVTCRSYRDRALASYASFSKTIPDISADVFRKFVSDEDRIFDASTAPEAERRVAYDSLYRNTEYLPFRMRRSLAGIYASSGDYDPGYSGPS